MASIPLPALDLKPTQPNDALGSMEKLMALKSMMGQQQIQQQQIQSNQQEQQLQAQKIADQQLTQKYLQDNPKSTFSDAADALKGKISVPAYTNLMDTDATVRQKHSQATESDLKNLASQHAEYQRIYNNIANLPDDQLAQQTPQIAAQINAIPGGTFKLDPSKPLTQAQLQQIGPTLGVQEAYLKQEQDKRKEAAEAAKDTAAAGESNAAADLKRKESDYYAKHGGAPGVSAEIVQQNDWIDKHPGKTPADFLAYKATLPINTRYSLENGAGLPGGPGGPAATPAQTAQRFGMSQEAFDQAAEKYFTTGQLPPLGRGVSGVALNRALMNRSGDLHPGASLAGNEAAFKANQQSLGKLQTNFDQVSAFENTAGKNLDLFLNKLSAIPDLGVKFANVPLRAIDANMIGSDNYAAMKAAQQTAASEAAKVLGSANASGVLSDSQKKEAEDMLSGNLSLSAAKQVVATLHQDFANRHQSYQEQIGDIQKRITGAPATTPNAAPGGASQPGSGKTLTSAQIKQAATDHNVSIEEATRQAKAAGYTIQ